MNKFTLIKRNNFPKSVEVGGVNLTVDPDFRTILRISKLNNDDEVSEKMKIFATLEWFYADDTSKFNDDELLNGLRTFMSNEDKKVCDGDNTSEKQMLDFELDAEEIYSGFLAEYGIDLIEIEYLHFYKFAILLRGLSSNSVLKKKIEFRNMDLKDIQKMNNQELIKAHKNVQIPKKLTQAEKDFIKEWGG